MTIYPAAPRYEYLVNPTRKAKTEDGGTMSLSFKQAMNMPSINPLQSFLNVLGSEGYRLINVSTGIFEREA